MRVVAQLSPGWRVVDDGTQWVLQRRAEVDKWYPRRYFTTRDPLVDAVSRGTGPGGRSFVEEVDPGGLAALEALPAAHPRSTGRRTVPEVPTPPGTP